MGLDGTPPSSVDMAEEPLAAALHHHRDGRLAEAEALYRRVLEADPQNGDAWHLLGVVALQSGRTAVALDLIDRAIAIDGGNPTYHSNRATALHTLGRPEQALLAYEAVLALKPDDAETRNTYGTLLKDSGRHVEALAAYDAALRSNPDHARFHYNRGVALHELGRLDEALTAYAMALALSPEDAEAHNNRGIVLKELGRFDEALAAFDKAAARPGPAKESARINRAVALVETGRPDEALALLDAVIRDHPHSMLAWYSRLGLKIFTPNDPDIAAMEALLRDSDGHAQADRVLLHFALAKAYLDTGDDDRAFLHLDQGNRLQRAVVTFDEDAASAKMAAIATVFSTEFLELAAGNGADSTLPVFIVGMPRSGTTLVEQILASHPLVHGAGELPTLQTVADGIADYPWGITNLEPENFTRIGQAYLDRIRPLAADFRHVIDKMPANFLHTGLIRLILPNARIIHCRRDPVDTCLSCYTKLFTGDLPFAYDLGELGRYHRAYQNLMAHWREVLPNERFIEVDYEALVDDLEAETRRLTTFLGLPWDAACLRFHENRRVVRTASINQVRRPIYTGSVGRWRRYAPHLPPLLDALGV